MSDIPNIAKQEELSNYNTRHTVIAKINNMEPYDICKDLINTKCNITFGQVLDICPKLKNELSKNLKLDKVQFISSIDKETILHNMNSTHKKGS
ncbi:hypothetical protein BCR36DRAFT_442114 [Piromyces finnis]|uniref:Uncharacterized protein n=1 Tax=Piromyces finnis TaxID=1754191 RepID=A0A1Y1VDR1_9FUNG|nr:hypothetical protein BCR36DRAFT_442114 [Piromyces finnis]|eukprot:ORX53755.1 hypothetical protein BCR36DRAFT_442114 [Piromyces finnis]